MCNGLGGTDFTKLCDVCGGKGFIDLSSGALNIRNSCNKCTGTGVLPQAICTDCNGRGIKVYERSYEAIIPSGFKGGSIIVPGKGSPGLFGGEQGDLLLEVSIRFPTINVNDISGEEMEILKKYLDV
jgi:molecular chaperone DnaJ